MKIKFIIPLLAAYIAVTITNADYGTVSQRHDIAKSLIGQLDDKIVASGLITDKQLHKIGAALGLCEELK